MNHGVSKVRPDYRDRDFHRTFGTVATLPQEFNTDAGLTNPNQMADGRPNSCRAYAQTELCGDQDKTVYDVAFTDEMQCFIEGVPTGSPGDIRTSLKSVIIYGVKKAGENQSAAFFHRRGAYYSVRPTTDWFEGIKQAIYTGGRSVSVATPWFWGDQPPAVLPPPSKYVWNGVGHNWKICGWKMIDGQQYLVGKPWVGPEAGDKGFVYVSRELANGLMKIPGTGAFTVAPYTSHDIQTVRLNILELLQALYYRLSKNLGSWLGSSGS